ncbi:MAG: type IV pilus twitching motility protein PilT [Gemmatimonadales bacterium]
MARLDRFIQVMQEHAADALALVPGQPMSLLRGTAATPLTKDALTGAQILALAREIVPAAMQSLLSDSAELSFSYRAPMGEVQAELAPGTGGTALTIRLATARGPAAPAPAPAASAPARVVARPSEAYRPPQELAGPRAQLDALLRLTAERGASDLHLRTGEPPILRLDGELVRLDSPAVERGALDQMIQGVMGSKDWEEFAETGDMDWAYELEGVARFRANAARERKGPMAVFRVIMGKILTVDQLGLGLEIQKLCYLSKGLVVVTGPTGCGKSTTLAALVDLMNRNRMDHILTIEDPVEFVHQSKKCLVTQRQVGLHTRSFKHALRAALREDPDVILVGEMRDLETVSIAIETAETGHLVFGTLHTTTAASTLDRIIDQFPADRQSQVRVMLSESLRGVIAQVLCRKIGGGRAAAREVLLTIPAVSNLIREGKTYQIPSIMQTNRKIGMVTLNDALMELVEAKVVEPKEAYFKSVEKTAFASALKAKRFDTSFLSEA